MKAVKEGGFMAQRRGGAQEGKSRAPASIWFISHYRNPPVSRGIETVCSRKTLQNKMSCTLLLCTNFWQFKSKKIKIKNHFKVKVTSKYIYNKIGCDNFQKVESRNLNIKHATERTY